MTYQRRPTSLIPLPAELGSLPVRPDGVIVQFEKGKTLDIGALCYLKRSDKRRRKNEGRLVDIASYAPARAEAIKRVIQLINEEFRGSGRRPLAIYSQYWRWAGFIDWCDAHGHSGVLRDEASARAAFRDNVAELNRLVTQHRLGNNHAAATQYAVKGVFDEFFQSDDFAYGLNLLSLDRNLVVQTPVPSEEAQSRVLAWSTCIFNGLTHLVLDRDINGQLIPFPYALSVPGYLGMPGNQAWVFPLIQWCCRKTGSKNCAYDYSNGRILNESELAALQPRWQPRDCRQSASKARATLERANSNQYHRERLKRGFLAEYAFFTIFLAGTGANLAQALNTRWSEDLEKNVLEPTTLRQGFRTIKYRAGGKTVSFEIGLEYMPFLRRFIELRRYLLMDNVFDYLFFGYPEKEMGGSPQLLAAGSVKTNFYRSLRQFDPDLQQVTPRQWRASKQNHLIRNVDPVLSAELMQHSLPVALRSYTNGSEVDQQREMGSFLDGMSRVVLRRAEPTAGCENRAIGVCNSPEHPHSAVPDPPVLPDCTRPEGCLFCTHFRVHADPIDARKLLSARYCIRVAGRYAGSHEEHERVFRPILQRIDLVLAEIRQRNNGMLERIETEVDEEGELDSFWSAKLETLLALGMELV